MDLPASKTYKVTFTITTQQHPKYWVSAAIDEQLNTGEDTTDWTFEEQINGNLSVTGSEQDVAAAEDFNKKFG